MRRLRPKLDCSKSTGAISPANNIAQAAISTGTSTSVSSHVGSGSSAHRRRRHRLVASDSSDSEHHTRTIPSGEAQAIRACSPVVERTRPAKRRLILVGVNKPVAQPTLSIRCDDSTDERKGLDMVFMHVCHPTRSESLVLHPDCRGRRDTTANSSLAFRATAQTSSAITTAVPQKDATSVIATPEPVASVVSSTAPVIDLVPDDFSTVSAAGPGTSVVLTAPTSHSHVRHSQRATNRQICATVQQQRRGPKLSATTGLEKRTQDEHPVESLSDEGDLPLAKRVGLPVLEYRRLLSLGGQLQQYRGLNIQRPWARLILDGVKTVEARRYPLKGYGGELLWIIETPGRGPLAKMNSVHLAAALRSGTLPSGLGAGAGSVTSSGSRRRLRRTSRDASRCCAPAVAAATAAARIVGVVRFREHFEYESYDHWRSDAKRHCVPSGSDFDWQPQTGPMYGWLVDSARALAEPQPGPEQKGMIGSRAVTRMALFA